VSAKIVFLLDTSRVSSIHPPCTARERKSKTASAALQPVKSILWVISSGWEGGYFGTSEALTVGPRSSAKGYKNRQRID